MAAGGGVGVVVWEWQTEFGSWRPYDPKISTFIEASKNSALPLMLGSVDPNLYQYVLDLQNMCQTRQGTGTTRNVRRTIYPSSSPLARGITWQWEGDIAGRWNDYDAEVTEFLETNFTKNKTTIDMSTSKFMLPYHIDLQKMIQTRIETGRVRKIQRVFMKATYLPDTGSPGKRSLSSTVNNATAQKQPRHTHAAYGSSASLIAPSGMSAPSNTPSASSSFSGPAAAHNNTAHNNTAQTVSLTSLGSNIANVQGPITRQRYNQMSTRSQLGQLPVPSLFQTFSGSQPSQPSNSHVQPNYSMSGAASGFHFGGSGMLNSVFNSLSSSALGGMPSPAGGLIGGQVPSGHYSAGPPSGGFGTSRHGRFVPHSLLSGSKSSKVRPSQSSSSSTGSLPQRAVIPNYKDKSSKRHQQANTGSAADSILDNFSAVLAAPPKTEDCCICCERLVEGSGHGGGGPEDHVAVQLDKCSHMFHKTCLRAMYDSGSKDGSLQCPTCKTIYGEKRGNCPRGEMEYRVVDSELEGHEGHRTIQIMYHIHSGVQGPEHPHPGARYSCRGFPRIGFLPDCDTGRKVLQLLIVAWKRRLTFTVGSSTTTGEANTVTWNEIHHKTEPRGNYSGHGYPDPNFLDNVMLELATHGITEKDLPQAAL